MTWGLDETPLVLGRSRQCQVFISDPSVSRLHCEIVLDDNYIYVKDLGSSNATLVNGRPVTQSRLKAGDEIAVGPAVFVVTRLERSVVHAGGSPELAREDRTTTFALHPRTPQATGIAVAPIIEARPKTVQDLAELWDIGRELASVATVPDLVQVLRHRVQERFGQCPVWVARCQGEEHDLVFYDDGKPGHEAAPIDVMQGALRDSRPRQVAKHRGSGRSEVQYNVYAAPIVCGGSIVGAIAAEREVGESQSTEQDLMFLTAVAHEAASHFLSIERLEQLNRDIERLRARAGESTALIGQSKAIQDVRQALQEAAQSGLAVLLLGETGTGKELAARLIHDWSRRSAGPFVVVNCAAIPASLFESEMFGHERGAFTGADRAHQGRVQQAHGGTLFLDEIGELTPESQARMLRLVENGTFYRVGATKETKVDIRIVAATNKNIPSLSSQGTFRDDLYHRINGFEIMMPPLRDRPSDIPILAAHFLDLVREEAKRPIRGLHPDAVAYLRERPWPGNVRELRRCIERAMALARSDVIGVEDLLVYSTPAEAASTPKVLRPLAEVEREHIAAVLQSCGGKVTEAANILKIGRSTLYNKIAEYQIDTE